VLRREVRILRQLSHPGIPRYVDELVAGSGSSLALCLVQEFVDGQDLAAEMESHRYRELEVVEIVQQVLDILAYLHGLSPPVVHRDLKPSNVMRRSDGGLVLVDFGSVRDAFLDPEEAGDESLGYMAPEQLAGKAAPASDLYALGALAVTLLTRREPHTLTDADGRLDWRRAAEVKPETAKLLDALLEPVLAKRVQSVAEARPLCEEALDALLGRARPEPAPPPPRQPRAGLRLAVALLVSLLATGGVAALLLLQDPVSREDPPGIPEAAPPPVPAPVPAPRWEPPVAPPTVEPARPRKRARRAPRVRQTEPQKPVGRAAPREVPAAPPPAPKPAGPPRYAKFPQFLASLRPMTLLRREIFRDSFPGTLLEGRGTVVDVARCRDGRGSVRWGQSCVEVRLREGNARITLYYGSKDEALTVALNPGAEHSFARCTGVATSLRMARCDMP
jgi:serine/threonine protein kinase